ncbi:hypothetical protein BC629DRAFT_257255 [Irpex lacteus]|nr:hypothetical protein BC629DRAFT_257255 [Irpex lacteus]
MVYWLGTHLHPLSYAPKRPNSSWSIVPTETVITPYYIASRSQSSLLSLHVLGLQTTSYSVCYAMGGMGPHNSRCFWTRILACQPTSAPNTSTGFTLIDFNRLDIARDLKRAGKAYPKSDRSATLEEKTVRFLRGNRNTGQTEDVSVGANEQIVRHPTVIHNDVLFDRDIVTTLPYRETRLQWNGPQPIFLFGGETWVACTQGEVNESFSSFFFNLHKV